MQKKEVYGGREWGAKKKKKWNKVMSMRYRATVSIFKYFSFFRSINCKIAEDVRDSQWNGGQTGRRIQIPNHTHTHSLTYYKTFYNYTHMIVSGSAAAATAEMSEYILLFFNWSGFVLLCFVRVDESVLFIITKQSSCCLPSRTFAKK